MTPGSGHCIIFGSRVYPLTVTMALRHPRQAILDDLFPGAVIPEIDYGQLKECIIEIMTSMKLQAEPCQIKKVPETRRRLSNCSGRDANNNADGFPARYRC